jgi:hypothetical protein
MPVVGTRAAAHDVQLRVDAFQLCMLLSEFSRISNIHQVIRSTRRDSCEKRLPADLESFATKVDRQPTHPRNALGERN